MTTISVVAIITAKPGTEDFVERALLNLIAPSQNDKGYIQYDLHRDMDKPNVFVFYENWESKELLDLHLQSTHLSNYQKQVEGMIESWDLKLMKKIS